MTQQTDFRALCAELADELATRWPSTFDLPDCLQRARAALAEPGPEVVGPTDEELLETLDKATADFPPRHPEAESLNAVEYPLALELRKARAVLARWVHQPAPPAGELLKEAAWLRNECSAENADGNWISMSIDQALDLASLLERQAAPAAAEGEAGKLVTLLRQVSDGANACGDEGTAWITARAADLLEQRQAAPVPVAPYREVADLVVWLEDHSSECLELDRPEWSRLIGKAARFLHLYLKAAPVPVAVSERLPGTGDCDAEGRVWGTAELGGWRLVHHSKIGLWRAWLPAHALPLPGVEVQ